MKKLGLTEWILLEVIFLSLVWLIDDYTGSLLSLVLGLLFITILFFSYIFELIEKSKVPRWYYRFLFFSFVACFAVMIIFTVIKGGQFDWMEDLF